MDFPASKSRVSVVFFFLLLWQFCLNIFVPFKEEKMGRFSDLRVITGSLGYIVKAVQYCSMRIKVSLFQSP